MSETSKTERSLLGKFLLWRAKNIPHQRFVLLLSIVVGVLAGLAAVIIKWTVHLVQRLLENQIIASYYTFWYFLFPILGILLVVIFVRYIVKQPVGHGVSGVLYAISKNNGIMKRYQMFASIVASSLTVGFGGSVGLEGPTITAGTATGSNLAQLLHLNYRTRILLIGCAAAGTMAAIFKAPIAAIVFAIEVFMLDLTFASLVPLLLASVAAVLIGYAFHGEDYILPLVVQDVFEMNQIVWYVAFGLLCGIMSVYFSEVFFFVEKSFSRLKGWLARLLIAGLMLGLLIFLFPPLFGEGFKMINNLLAGNEAILFENSLFSHYEGEIGMVLIILAAVVLLKIFATALTFAAGGVGGIFAPTLFMGSALGYLFSRSVNAFSNFSIPVSNFTLVGMAGILAGVLHAPLTAIFLIAELTGGYQLFIPLMVTTGISFALSRSLRPHSVYTSQLAKRGELLTHHKDKLVLNRLMLSKLVERNFHEVSEDMSLGELVKVVSTSKRNIFPVLDEQNGLLGIVTLDDIREVMFEPELYETKTVHHFMRDPMGIVQITDGMELVVEKFKLTGAWNLAVMDGEKYVGFISKSKLFTSYRSMLVKFSDD